MEERNQFLDALENVTYTENGAITNVSTKNEFVDQFGLAGNYRDRDIQSVFADQEALYNADPLKALKFIFYLRAISRKTKEPGDGMVYKDIVRGQGSRDEAFKRLLWFAKGHPKTFYCSATLLPVIGRWKDLWDLMYLDEKLELNLVNRDKIYDFIAWGLDIACKDLVKKYMPRIKADKKCTTAYRKAMNKYAKEFATRMGVSYKEYNKIKTSGLAHEFQKNISWKTWLNFDWNTVPGKALLLLGSSKFIPNQDMTPSFKSFVENASSLNFNGYPYELLKKIDYKNESAINIMLNKQFDTLLATANEGGGINGNVWCALDTSASMGVMVNKSVSAYDICVSLGIYFSSLNKGAYKDTVVMFDDTSYPLKVEGTFSEKAIAIKKEKTAWGSTNFQSIIDLLVEIRRKSPSIPLEDYPTTILVISDMEFNPNSRGVLNEKEGRRKITEAFGKDYASSLKFVWWNVASRSHQFPATINDGGNYFFSGYDGTIINLLLGNDVPERKDISMEEIIDKALNQEVLNTLEIMD